VPLGSSGEICVRGPQVMKGYWNSPAETAKVLGPDGFFATGDVGVMDEKGYVRIVDRKKDMLLVSGFNVYPNEIESVVAMLPGVLECAVIGVPDARWGEAVKACVVLRKGQRAEPAEIIAWLRERLAGYKCPKSVDFMEVLPRNPSGKLLKRVLRQSYWEQQQRQVS
jgi:long-chain acyl-CoA synthetase